MSSEHWVIFGLGNVGPRYRYTRHNVGFMVVDEIARQFGAEFKDERRLSGRIAKMHRDHQTITLVKPTTFMNASGECVKQVLHYYKVPMTQIVIVYDDVALPFKGLRVRERGSSGGHNGLKSIEQMLQTQEYLRLRMGVGENVGYPDLADYVLAPFADIEQVELPSFVKEGAKVALRLTAEPASKVMNEVNKTGDKNERTTESL